MNDLVKDARKYFEAKEARWSILGPLCDEIERLKKIIQDLISKRVNPPVILSDDARAKVEAAHNEYKKIFKRLYWKKP